MLYLSCVEIINSGTSVNSYHDDRLELPTLGGYFIILRRRKTILLRSTK